ncbi:MAG: nucleotidyltransferase domain-containing protein [Gammaproteobacteria bacterium]|nr:nucleotidyltransferase domain-containing protein [Gammaproteobacteria bacterium]
MPNMGTIIPNMGMQEKKPTDTASLSTLLFSNTQQRVLAYLFGQPERSFYTTELIKLTKAGSGAVQRELKRFGESGLVTVQMLGNQKHYQANPKSPIYSELCGIVQKTFGLAGPLQNAIAPIAGQVQAAFVYGSVAKKSDTASSDIDLMIISDTVSYPDVIGSLGEVENRLGRQINPTIYTNREWLRRVEDKNAFVNRIQAQNKIWLIGDEHDLAP